MRVAKKSAGQLRRLALLSKNFAYADSASSVALPFDTCFVRESKKLAAKYKNVELVVVIGIGGSNLGSQAVTEAIQGKYFNLFSKKKLMWLDSIDADAISAVVAQMSATKPNKTLLIVISKSGTTTETIANLQVLLRLKQLSKQANVVAISDRNSALHLLAEKKGFDFLEVPKNVGGRYSVFSNVGLFPFAVIGIDVDALLSGAKVACNDSFSLNWRKNQAATIASLLYLHRKNRIRINETFLFANNLESLGKWYRQLLAESIGKEKNLREKVVNEGITPIVSTAVDLHSQAQLYFSGPNDRFFTIVDVKNQSSFLVEPDEDFVELVPQIQGKATAQITRAISTGFKRSLINHARPFVEVTFDEINEKEIGYFMQVGMIQTMLLANLLNVNAFDQPNVEDYKKETKTFLTRE